MNTAQRVARHLRQPAPARARALDVAGELLVTRGLVALTVNAVADRAGMSRQSVERWWPSEEALALDALRHEWLGLVQQVRAGAFRCGLH